MSAFSLLFRQHQTFPEQIFVPGISRVMSASTNVQFDIIFHRRSPSLQCHMRMASYIPGELIPSAFVWLDPGIIPCCKSLFASLNTDFPSCRRRDRIIMWGTTSSCDELTGDFGDGLEATSTGDCGLFRL